MTKKQQRALFNAIVRNVRKSLLLRSGDWPEAWDGHELRELLAVTFERERTSLMTEKRSRRRKDARNEMLVKDLY